MDIARWALGDPGWPKTAMAFGGKFGIDDDTETPNTLTAGFSYGDRAAGRSRFAADMTNGEGATARRIVPGGGRTRAPRRGKAPVRLLRLRPRPRRWDRPVIRSTSVSAIFSTAPTAGPR